MRKILLFTGLIFSIFILSYPKLTTAYVNGSPGGKSGSPLDGGNCTMCHGNNVNTGPGSFNISSDIPVSGFVPGETYTITIQGAHPSFNKYGFELTAESLGTKVGGFNITNSSQTKLTNNNNSVTHKNTGTLGSATKSWTVNWIAPITGNTTVDFYASGIAANGNGVNDNGDEVYTSTYSVNKENSVSIDEKKENIIIYSLKNNILIEGNSNLNKVIITDISGKKIYIDENVSLPIKINTSNFKSGLFILSYFDINNDYFHKKVYIY